MSSSEPAGEALLRDGAVAVLRALPYSDPVAHALVERERPVLDFVVGEQAA